MKRSFLKTADGSLTIHLPEWDEQYHSKHGAIAEAKYVYIQEGYDFYRTQNPITSPVRILEIGFGTGLNCLLTKILASELGQEIRYTGVEKFPVEPQEASQLNYMTQLKQKGLDFKILHESPWEQWNKLSADFTFFKHQNDFVDLNYSDQFDVLYFDAFGPRVQPELWTEAIFKSMYEAMSPKGVLVTYCCQGNARRAMTKVGFTVVRLPGPPGKRHMLRAVKMP